MPAKPESRGHLRQVPCPLCSVKVQIRHLTKSGICVACEDARAEETALSAKNAASVTTRAEDVALARYELANRAKMQQKALKEAEERAAYLKSLEREKTSVEREQASRELARRSLLHFTERRVNKFDASWAHELVASQLEEFYADVAAGKNPRMIITLPSRFGKSELASISGPLWALGHHPTWRFVLASYSDVLPVEFSRTIRAELQGDAYRELFPSGAELSPDDASVKAWSTTQGGALRATGVGGGLLGFGANCLIIDDPVKDVETAENPDALEKLWQWFSSVAYSRLLPGGGILVIQQRMAVNDLVGRLIQNQRLEEARLAELYKDIADLTAASDMSSEVQREIQLLTEEAEELDASMDRWRYLEYPALATMDEYYDYSTGQIIRQTPGESAPPSLKPLRKRGEAIHERRYGRSYLLKLKRNNPKMFQAMYMLNPLANEGEYFGVKDFRRYEYGHHPKTENLHVFCAWDLAIGTKQQNDYTVGVAGAIDHQGQLWILDLVRGKFGDVDDIADRVIDLHKKWGASITGIEHTVITMALGPVLTRRMQERKQFITLTEGKERLIPITDKQVRARSLQGLCRAGKVLLPTGDEFDGLLAEMTQFGSAGVHDDQVDACSWLAILALRTAPPADPKASRVPAETQRSWLDELLDDIQRGVRGYMAS